MKTIVLSDHTQDMIRAEEEKRREEHQRRIDEQDRGSEIKAQQHKNEVESRRRSFELKESEYNRSMAERLERRTQLKRGISHRWRRCRIFGMLWWILKLLVHAGSRRPPRPRLVLPAAPVKPHRPAMAPRGQQEVIWTEGRQGEQKVFNHLGSVLRDEWTLLRGYKNPKGEIDAILVGPKGVWAMEIKNLNCMVNIVGDQWFRDNYDNYGNRVKSNIPIKDGAGRSPSKQLNEPADRLLERLRQVTGLQGIARVVVLSHDKCRIGRVDNLTIDSVVALRVTPLNRLLERSASSFDDLEVERLVKYIAQDHDYHNRPREQGRRRAELQER